MSISLKLFFAAMILGSLAQAETEQTTITCTFTKPYLTTIYKNYLQSFVVYDPFSEKTTPPQAHDKAVMFRATGPKTFEIVDTQGTVLQKYKLTFKGTDGISDTVYPLEVVWYTDRVPTHKLVGGCTMISED